MTPVVAPSAERAQPGKPGRLEREFAARRRPGAAWMAGYGDVTGWRPNGVRALMHK
jgi:hypothetical protein